MRSFVIVVEKDEKKKNYLKNVLIKVLIKMLK